MCMMIYMAADKLVKEIPWNQDKPAFHVIKIDENSKYWVKPEYVREIKEGLSKNFKPKHLYYVGSSEGCGCNFPHSYLAEKDSSTKLFEYRSEKNQSFFDKFWNKAFPRRYEKEGFPDLKKLITFLKDISNEHFYIEIYGRWAGDEGLAPLKTTEVGLSEINSDTFAFGEGELFKIKLRE